VNSLAADPSLEELTRRVEEARDLVAKNRTDEGISAFTEIVERWPDVAEFSAILCTLLIVARRSDVKPEWVARAIGHKAKLAEMFHGESLRLYAEGDPQGAANYIEGIALAAPGEAGILSDLGVVRLELDDAAGAEAAFRSALESEPDHAPAQEGLAHLLAEPGRKTEVDDLIATIAETPATPEKSEPPAEAVADSQEPVAGDPAVFVAATTAPSQGAIRQFAVKIQSDGPEGEHVLSMDVYPVQSPGHPDRHHGYWNREITLRRGESTTVEVAWDWSNREVTFDGKAANDTWQGPLDEPGEYAVTFVVFAPDGRAIARDHIQQWIGPKSLKSAIWFLTWRCNLRCAYCWEVQRIVKGELEPDPFRPAEEWTAAWNRLLPGMLDITGGEPFLQPNFLEMLEGFDDRIRVAITTNLSRDMTEFVQRISPEKVVSMTLSLHPTQKLNFDHFLGRALMLKNRGFNLTVNYVTWPEQLWLIPKYKDIIESEGLRFHVDPYAPTPHYPYEFSEAEKTFLRQYVGEDRASHWFGEVDKAPVKCSGGFEHINVMPGGEAYRCIGDKVWNKPSFGNIFDPEFALNEDWTRCADYHRCPACDKDKVRVEQITED
jgi:MoaA/NifB/PqqE/SkfB family radical SAM enzyme